MIHVQGRSPVSTIVLFILPDSDIKWRHHDTGSAEEVKFLEESFESGLQGLQRFLGFLHL